MYTKYDTSIINYIMIIKIISYYNLKLYNINY